MRRWGENHSSQGNYKVISSLACARQALSRLARQSVDGGGLQRGTITTNRQVSRRHEASFSDVAHAHSVTAPAARRYMITKKILDTPSRINDHPCDTYAKTHRNKSGVRCRFLLFASKALIQKMVSLCTYWSSAYWLMPRCYETQHAPGASAGCLSAIMNQDSQSPSHRNAHLQMDIRHTPFVAGPYKYVVVVIFAM
jgi:hypothetical protein